MGPSRAPRRHADTQGTVHDARSAVLHRSALRSWREHSMGHACPASHAPRTSRLSMSSAVIAGTLVFRSSWGPVGALSKPRRTVENRVVAEQARSVFPASTLSLESTVLLTTTAVQVLYQF